MRNSDVRGSASDPAVEQTASRSSGTAAEAAGPIWGECIVPCHEGWFWIKFRRIFQLGSQRLYQYLFIFSTVRKRHAFE
jgi:hypothetical protein